MVPLIRENNGNSSWQAWALGIAILLISGLASIGIANLTWQFNAFVVKIEHMVEKNHEQDLCLKELQINQQERLRREQGHGR